MGFDRETRTLPHIDPKGPTYIGLIGWGAPLRAFYG